MYPSTTIADMEALLSALSFSISETLFATDSRIVLIFPPVLSASFINVIARIITLLLVIERSGSLLIILFLSLSSVGYYYFSRKHLFNWGKKQQYLDGKILQVMQR